MIRAQRFIRKRWILASICLLWVVYLYRQSPEAGDQSHSKWPGYRLLTNPRMSSAKDPELAKTNSIQILNQSAKGLKPEAYNPYPQYNSVGWKKKWKGTHAPCVGPRGASVNGHLDDTLMAYHPKRNGPVDSPMFGSFEDTGLDPLPCFTSNTRYLPYGYMEESGEGVIKPSDPSKVTWEDLNWGDLQKECLSKNQDRYNDVDIARDSPIFRYAEYADVEKIEETLRFLDDQEEEEGHHHAKKGSEYKQRTAVIFQVQESREWTLDTTQYVRSVIMELSLHTGGEYEAFILIEVSDDAQPIFNNPGVYKKIIERSVPREFQGIAHLFNRRLVKHWYPKTHDNVVKPPYTYAPLQLLSLARPDLEHFWLMDVDARYTGHHYDHFEEISRWSQAQPRQVLWETASQIYMKGVHKSWDNFTTQIKNAAKKSLVRGPLLTEGIDPIGPDPPLFHSGKDRWGIGEEADLITFGPVFDPAGSSFLARGEVDNFPDGTEFTPRRATAFSAMTRTSKRLLRVMHYGQFTQGMNMAPSMFPASTALHHGLKVVAFPTPIYFDATIAPEKIEEVFNHPGWGRHTYDSPYKFTELWRRMTFAIATEEHSTFADQLYRRWLGYDEKRTRGLCLPGIMLHPVQGV